MSEHVKSPTKGELLDVVDIYGNPTGEVVDKRAIHAQGLRHRDVHVWITDGRNVLQQQRAGDKPLMPGAWDAGSVGGHVPADQSYRDAGVRETREELGVWYGPKQLKRVGLVAVRLDVPGWQHPHNVIGDNFVVYDPGLRLGDLQLQDDEVQDARWYSIDQLEQDLLSPETAGRHAPQPMTLYALGIAGMRGVAAA